MYATVKCDVIINVLNMVGRISVCQIVRLNVSRYQTSATDHGMFANGHSAQYCGVCANTGTLLYQRLSEAMVPRAHGTRGDVVSSDDIWANENLVIDS